jgi:hypothetical protein
MDECESIAKTKQSFEKSFAEQISTTAKHRMMSI